MIVKNINIGGRLLRGAVGIYCLKATTLSGGSALRTVLLIAVGAICIFQAAVSM